MAVMPMSELLELALPRMPEGEHALIRGLWNCGELVVVTHADVRPGPGITHILVVPDDTTPHLIKLPRP